MDAIGQGRRLFLASASARLPWNRPQSSRTVVPFARTTWQDPVTSRAAPANSISMSARCRPLRSKAANDDGDVVFAAALESDRKQIAARLLGTEVQLQQR